MMLRGEDLPPEVRAKLGITKRGRPKKADEDQADRDFLFQCKALHLPPAAVQWRFTQSEYPNAASRKWRCDVVFLDFKVMVEIDGGIWIKGAHGHPYDIIRNMKKGNDAALQGFTVLHFTPAEVKSGHAISFTQKVLKSKGWIN
jgi:hypothetical protein